MKVRLQMIIESEAGHVEVIKEVVTLERSKKLRPDRLGLSLAESKLGGRSGVLQLVESGGQELYNGF